MASSKKTGKKSQAANDFLAPFVPTIGTATNVGTGRAYNNGAATVTFTANVDGQPATSYTATSSPGGYTASGASSPLTVTGLQSATAYTFTVTATNAIGTSSASSASNSITATTVPQTIQTAAVTSTVANRDDLTWTAPETGGSAITSYTVTSTDGPSYTGILVTSKNIDETGGTSQSYDVYALNANGTSLAKRIGPVTTFFSPPAFFAPPLFFGPPGFFAPPSFFAPPNFSVCRPACKAPYYCVGGGCIV